jgi:hypothetical protein
MLPPRRGANFQSSSLFVQTKRGATVKNTSALAALSAIIFALGAIPAHATTPLLNRSFVSASGTDNDTCGAFTTPCASFQGALTNTAVGGEINCITAGDFGGDAGTLTINTAVSIVCDGVSNGGILNATATAIKVNAPAGAMVYLSGLNINGVGRRGEFGIDVATGSTVYINHCTIQGFADYGVELTSPVNPTRVVISDSILVNNGVGVGVYGSNGAANGAIIFNSIIDGNQIAAAQASGNGQDIGVADTVLSGSPNGLNLEESAAGVLVGPSNAIAGAINGSPVSVDFK